MSFLCVQDNILDNVINLCKYPNDVSINMKSNNKMKAAFDKIFRCGSQYAKTLGRCPQTSALAMGRGCGGS